MLDHEHYNTEPTWPYRHPQEVIKEESGLPMDETRFTCHPWANLTWGSYFFIRATKKSKMTALAFGRWLFDVVLGSQLLPRWYGDLWAKGLLRAAKEDRYNKVPEQNNVFFRVEGKNVMKK